VVHHDPPEQRVLRLDEILDSVTGIRCHDIVIGLIDSFRAPSGEGGAAGNLNSLGAHLKRYGELPAGDFEEYLRTEHLRLGWKLLEPARRKLRTTADRAPLVRRDVEKYIARIELDLDPGPPRIIPRDLVHWGDADRALRAMQTLLVRFGELLREWPGMVQAAKELRARGVRLASSVMPAR
jgi:hypothetical protein